MDKIIKVKRLTLKQKIVLRINAIEGFIKQDKDFIEETSNRYQKNGFWERIELNKRVLKELKLLIE